MTSSDRFSRITLIGGAGYVGTVLARHLLDAGYSVKVVDLFLYGRSVFDELTNNSRLRLVQADIRDSERLRDALQDTDAVVHLACISNDPSFELDPKLGKSINYDAFLSFLQVLRNTKVRRLIYASSSSVYGVKTEPDVREETACEPLTDYSKFKLLCELALRESGVNCEYVILRPATVCGFSPRLRLDLTVNILTISALAKGEITVYGGSQLRPNINIKDMAEAYRVVLEAPAEKVHREVFNVGYENLSVRTIAELVIAEVGDDSVRIKTVPSDDLRSYHINSDRIKSVLGFAPQWSVAEAVQSIRTAFRKGHIVNALENPSYYNIRRMKELQLA